MGDPKKRTQDYRSLNSVSFSTSSTSISIYPFLFSSLPVWSTCQPRNLRGCSRRLIEMPVLFGSEVPALIPGALDERMRSRLILRQLRRQHAWCCRHARRLPRILLADRLEVSMFDAQAARSTRSVR